VLVSSFCLLAGTAGAAVHATPTVTTENACVVHSLPSFVAQGEGVTTATVADVIEVNCDPTKYGTKSKIKVTAFPLYTLCEGDVTWYVPNNAPDPTTIDELAIGEGGYEEVQGSGVELRLDPDGNATAALIAGPNCSAGESLVSAHMEETPFESFTTSFSVLPPDTTVPGVYSLPATQVEDSYSSAAATIIEAEFADGSEKTVHIASEELFDRCQIAPHLHWISMGREETSDVSEVNGVELDNDGNAFVLAIGDSSCAPGPSLIEADLESKPFTQFGTDFTIEAPRPVL
jgi:hypothetical protein